MKRRLLMSLVAAGVALGTAGVASANADYWRSEGLLLEVSADPRDGNDLVQVNPQRADQLELIALNARVNLRGITVHFADGRQFHTHTRGVMPGQPMMIDLPYNRGVITSVELDYIAPEMRRTDRTTARLQIRPLAGNGHVYQHEYQPAWRPEVRDHRTYPSYRQPAYLPAYRVKPRASWSGYVQGSFRF